MNKSKDEKGLDLWSDYWLTGQLAACTADFPEQARQAIASKWRQEFAALQSEATILDIATGKGALIALAAEAACPDRRLSATGVDLADVDLCAEAGLDGGAEIEIAFEGGVDAAKLPFEDRRFTLVVSQFGLEYADFEKAVAEACRVAGTRVVALVHAAEGPVVRQNSTIPAQISWLRDELGLFEAVTDYFRVTSDKTGKHLREVSTALKEKCATPENPDFLASVSNYVGRLIAELPAIGSVQCLEYLEAMEAQLVRHAGRMAALTGAARSEADLAKAAEICAAAGFGTVDTTVETSGNDAEPVGHWLHAERQTAE
jgi:ubiquinone/menaquinone biosynthesis C-methylase UbiE